MSGLDWTVIMAYLGGLLLLSARLGRRQQSRKDYYLGGNAMAPASLALSTIATQCSTNSLLGAPAFVGFVVGGGMLWLQYELAVPLAMLALMFLLGPLRQRGHISAYAFLEERLGPAARLVASSSFQLFRGVATGVTVYGVALVLTLLLGIGYTQAVLILMGVTIVYDVLGGMRAVVVSDVIQLVLIVAAVSASLVLLLDTVGLEALIGPRLTALDPSWGFAAEGDYGFWPMLIGGFFLYAAYYGCDQSQAQRVLAARSVADTQRVLQLNGLLRFPLVLLYCVLGLALAAYAAQHPGLMEALPRTSTGAPNVNLIYPGYVLQAFPPGLVGLVMVGIFAAAMSSIDSALNSLSAATVEDYLNRGAPRSERRLFIASKLATAGWGAFAVLFSYQVEHIAPTVLEAINKVGSLVNGPLLALFVVALVVPGVGQARAITGFAAGIACNVVLWRWAPGVSWLWWNAAGFVAAVATAVALKPVAPIAPGLHPSRAMATGLVAMAGLIFAACAAFTMAAGESGAELSPGP